MPTDKNVSPTISSESMTVLGVTSTHGNVMIHVNAPNNLNIHAAIYAGNDDAYDSATETGCGSTHPGCGFGYEGADTLTGKGSLKLLGSVSEFRPQTIG